MSESTQVEAAVVVRLEKGRKGPNDIVARCDDNKLVVFKTPLKVQLLDGVEQYAAVASIEDRGNAYFADAKHPLRGRVPGSPGPESLIVVAKNYDEAAAKVAVRVQNFLDLAEEAKAAREEEDRRMEELRLAKLKEFEDTYYLEAFDPGELLPSGMSLMVFARRIGESLSPPITKDFEAVQRYLSLPATAFTFPVSKRYVPEGQDPRYCVLVDFGETRTAKEEQ